ncbi:MAG TPA: 3-isopropylmalate dehydratase small subunit [Terriglobales bacterium]|nr:3-isopropylmalate dehydratase small subunit [Terriglobales bacterium]
MQAFRVHTGVVAPLDVCNVDTDQIIPKQFLKRVERTGFGQFLFHDWRYHPDGTVNDRFILNTARYRGASILAAGKNFGCGSSREHAPWALADYGFRAIIAPSFADIFANNCGKNGVLTVVLPEDAVAEVIRKASEGETYSLTIDLERCTVQDESGLCAAFNVDPFRRHCLLNGLDDIGLTLRFEDQITAYEARRSRP